MRNSIFIILSIFILFPTLSRGQDDYSTAMVEKYQGYFIFHFSKPVQEYDELGNIDPPLISFNGSASDHVKYLLRQLRKKYGHADGMIITDLSRNKAIAIKFRPPPEETEK